MWDKKEKELERKIKDIFIAYSKNEKLNLEPPILKLPNPSELPFWLEMLIFSIRRKCFCIYIKYYLLDNKVLLDK
jgi:hypothetical protein